MLRGGSHIEFHAAVTRDTVRLKTGTTEEQYTEAFSSVTMHTSQAQTVSPGSKSQD